MPTQEELNGQLLEAAKKGDADAVKALIAKGADLEAANEDGMTALMIAAQEGETEKVIALVEAGAKPNAAEKYGRTALMLAARDGHMDAAHAVYQTVLVPKLFHKNPPRQS